MKHHADFRLPRRAFTLLELLTTMAIIGILAALLLPALQAAHRKAKRAACGSNLMNIGVASHLWAHEHNDLFPAQASTNQGGTLEFAQATALNPDVSSAFRHFQALSNEIVTPKILVCPADHQRSAARNFETLGNGNVSYWINPGAVFGRPDSPLAGDRNVRTSGRTEWTFVQFGAGDAVEFSAELHGYRGNVLFGDGHRDDLDSRALRRAFAPGRNGMDVTLALPQRDVPTANSPDVSGVGSSSPANSGGASDGSGAGNNFVTRPPDVNSAPVAKENSNAHTPAMTASPPPNRTRAGNSPGEDGNTVVFTRLDGTFATSAVPRAIPGGVVEWRAPAPVVEMDTANPLIEFVEWLARKAARGTYWLLALLLVAFVAFDFARRRARRRRRGSDQ